MWWGKDWSNFGQEKVWHPFNQRSKVADPLDIRRSIEALWPWVELLRYFVRGIQTLPIFSTIKRPIFSWAETEYFVELKNVLGLLDQLPTIHCFEYLYLVWAVWEARHKFVHSSTKLNGYPQFYPLHKIVFTIQAWAGRIGSFYF